jgi:hypothetical protein
VRGSYAVDALDEQQQQGEHGDPEKYGYNVHAITIHLQALRPRDDRRRGYNDFVTDAAGGPSAILSHAGD